MEKAFDWLRKKGQASMAKRDRATKVRASCPYDDGSDQWWEGLTPRYRDAVVSCRRAWWLWPLRAAPP